MADASAQHAGPKKRLDPYFFEPRFEREVEDLEALVNECADAVGFTRAGRPHQEYIKTGEDGLASLGCGGGLGLNGSVHCHFPLVSL